MGKSCRRFFCVAIVSAFSFDPAFAAGLQYSSELDPVAHDLAGRENYAGDGNVSGRLDNSVLTVTGSFSGLSSSATAAHLEMGLAKGVPGSAIGQLTATAATAGKISGSVKLSEAEIAALKKGAIYVQLDSAKSPEGNLWGWLETGSAP